MARACEGAPLIHDRCPLMKRMLFVVNVDWFFLSHRWPIAEALMARGTEVHLATATTPDARAFLEDAGVVIHEIPFSRQGRSPVELTSLIRKLGRLHRAVRPDLAHNVTIKPVLVGSVASRLAGTKAVVNAISGFGHLLSDAEAGRLAPRATLQAYRIALCTPRRCRVVFQNRAALDDFVGRGIVQASDARLIPGMGVDPKRFHPPANEPSPPVVMLIGRMIRSKGVTEFLSAAPLIREAVPNTRCVLVGPTDDGNPLAFTETELRAIAFSAGVEYVGPVDDVSAAMRQSTVQVFPTYHEGLPKSLLEAAATARPIVASDIPGCREMVVEGENGRLIPVRDAAALAATVVELLEDAEQRARLGTNARRAILEAFTVEHAVHQHIELYEELLS